MSLWLAAQPLVLASQSKVRRALLEAAGIPVEARPAHLDERAIEERVHGRSRRGRADAGAREGAHRRRHVGPHRWSSAATRRWRWASGASPSRRTAPPRARSSWRCAARPTSCIRPCACVGTEPSRSATWRSHGSPCGTFRKAFSMLTSTPRAAAVTASVGAYQLERTGIHLFEKIEGDHFTILGLPLPALARRTAARKGARRMTKPPRLHHGPSGGAFALADAARLLAAHARDRRRPTSMPTCRRKSSRTFFRSLKRNGYAAATSPSRTRRPRSAWSTGASAPPTRSARSTRSGTRATRSSAATPTGTASWRASTTSIRAGTHRPAKRWCSAPAARRGPRCSRSWNASFPSRSSTARASAPRNSPREFGPRVSVHEWSDVPKLLGEADVLINNTSLGMAGKPPLDIDLAPLKTSAIVYDVVYVPLETATAEGREGERAIARSMASACCSIRR